MNIAIIQMPMAWTVEENTKTIIESLSQAKNLMANVAVFPECATTGWHSRILEVMTPQAIDTAIEGIKTACREIDIAAVVGTPYFPDDEKGVWDAVVVIDRFGELTAVYPKNGLAPGDDKFFLRGELRPMFFLDDVNCAAIICREYLDGEELRKQIPGNTQVVFWSSIISKDSDAEVPYECRWSDDIASELAKSLGVFLIQSNWPHWLDGPTKLCGKSMVVSPEGLTVYECPADEVGIAIIKLNLDYLLNGTQAVYKSDWYEILN